MSVEDLERDRKGSVEVRFPVPEPEEGLRVSGLLLGVCANTVTVPGEDSVRPSPSHVILAGEDPPCALLRWEAAPSETVQLRYEVRDRGGRVREEGEREVAAFDRRAIVRPSVDALPPGRYRLRVDLEGGTGRIRREAEFELAGGVATFGGDALEQRTVLSYVATGAELQELDRTDDEELPAFWEAFWARRDPRPETATNEGQAEFLRRVDYAIRNLGDMKPGWDTDRGEMYIRYGEPDRRETVPGGAGRLPTQIWYYDDRNLTLVFQDVDGSGHYRLAANRRR
jgi:GWxTD domain-containing protein